MPFARRKSGHPEKLSKKRDRGRTSAQQGILQLPADGAFQSRVDASGRVIDSSTRNRSSRQLFSNEQLQIRSQHLQDELAEKTVENRSLKSQLRKLEQNAAAAAAAAQSTTRTLSSSSEDNFSAAAAAVQQRDMRKLQKQVALQQQIIRELMKRNHVVESGAGAKDGNGFRPLKTWKRKVKRMMVPSNNNNHYNSTTTRQKAIESAKKPPSSLQAALRQSKGDVVAAGATAAKSKQQQSHEGETVDVQDIDFSDSHVESMLTAASTTSSLSCVKRDFLRDCLAQDCDCCWEILQALPNTHAQLVFRLEQLKSSSASGASSNKNGQRKWRVMSARVHGLKKKKPKSKKASTATGKPVKEVQTAAKANHPRVAKLEHHEVTETTVESTSHNVIESTPMDSIVYLKNGNPEDDHHLDYDDYYDDFDEQPYNDRSYMIPIRDDDGVVPATAPDEEGELEMKEPVEVRETAVAQSSFTALKQSCTTATAAGGANLSEFEQAKRELEELEKQVKIQAHVNSYLSKVNSMVQQAPEDALQIPKESIVPNLTARVVPTRTTSSSSRLVKPVAVTEPPPPVAGMMKRQSSLQRQLSARSVPQRQSSLQRAVASLPQQEAEQPQQKVHVPQRASTSARRESSLQRQIAAATVTQQQAHDGLRELKASLSTSSQLIAEHRREAELAYQQALKAIHGTPLSRSQSGANAPSEKPAAAAPAVAATKMTASERVLAEAAARKQPPPQQQQQQPAASLEVPISADPMTRTLSEDSSLSSGSHRRARRPSETTTNDIEPGEAEV